MQSCNKKGLCYVHRAIFYLNKHMENNWYRKRFNLPLFLAREGKDVQPTGWGGAGGGGGMWGGGQEEGGMWGGGG